MTALRELFLKLDFLDSSSQEMVITSTTFLDNFDRGPGVGWEVQTGPLISSTCWVLKNDLLGEIWKIILYYFLILKNNKLKKKHCGFCFCDFFHAYALETNDNRNAARMAEDPLKTLDSRSAFSLGCILDKLMSDSWRTGP